MSIGVTESLGVTLAETELVGAAKLLTIGAGYSVDVLGAESEVVGGLRSTQIFGLKFERVKFFRREFIKGTRTSRSLRASLQYEVDGNALVGVGRDFKEKFSGLGMIESKAPFRTKAGEIKVNAGELGICVGNQLRLLINKAGTVKIWGEKITIKSDGNTKIKGAKVKLKPGASTSRKPFREVLDPAEADTIEKYKSPDEAPLSEQDKSGFTGPVYQKVLKKDVPVKRLFGGSARERGMWVSKGGRPPGLEGKIRMALKPEWGNDASKAGGFVLPKGAVVFEGDVAAQGAMAGGAKQLLIREPEAIRQACQAAGSKAPLYDWLAGLPKG